MKSLPEQVTGKWFLLSIAVGVAAGLGAIIFDVLGQAVSHFVLGNLSGFAPLGAAGEHHLFEAGDTPFSFLALLAVLTVGGLISGCLVYTFAPEAEGHGTDAAIDTFHRKRGNITLRVAVVKTQVPAGEKVRSLKLVRHWDPFWDSD
jgi:CIC family chloride channel protein